MAETIVKTEETGAFPPAQVQDEKILGKFENAEELAKAYQELEKKLGQDARKEQPEAKPADQPEAKPTEGEQEAAEQTLTVAGLEMAEFSAEFSKEGKLSDASYSKLEAAGFPKQVVDAYIEGQKVLAAREAGIDPNSQAQEVLNRDFEKSVMDSVGGSEKYSLMTQWAGANLSPKELDTFNRIMESGNKDAIQWAVQGLANKYVKAMGSDPKLLDGRGSSDTGVYLSYGEVVAAMKDPRYQTDVSYRQAVYNKIARSNLKKK